MDEYINVDVDDSDVDASDVAEDMPEDISEDEPTDIDEGIPEDMPEDIPEDEPTDIEEEIPEDVPEDIPEDEPTDIEEEIPEDVPEDIPEDEPTDIEEDTSEDVPEDIPEDEPTDIEEDIPEDVPEDIPEDEPTDIEEDIPKDVPEDIPEDEPTDAQKNAGTPESNDIPASKSAEESFPPEGIASTDIEEVNTLDEENLSENTEGVDIDGYDDIVSSDISDDSPKVLKRNEFDLLKSGNDAINQRLAIQADEYRNKGYSEDEIKDRIATDKWNFQKEFLEDAFPEQDVSPHVFNGFNEDGAQERLEEVKSSPSLRETITDTHESAGDARLDAQPDHPEHEKIPDDMPVMEDPEVISDSIEKSNDSDFTEEYETPAVNSEFNANNDLPEIPKVSDISRDIVELFPENRRAAIDTAYADAPDELVEAINEQKDGLRHIKDSGYSINENGERVKDGCYYTDGSDTITMDEQMTDAEYSEVFPHEFGHYMDCQRGWESTTSYFTDAINKDFSSMDATTPDGKMRRNDMLDDAFSTGAAFDRNVSDILSATFQNDPTIVERFRKEGVAYYQHEDDYWSTPGMRQKEIYANNMGIQIAQSRISKNFIERNFPNIDSAFKQKYSLNK